MAGETEAARVRESERIEEERVGLDPQPAQRFEEWR